MGFWGIWLRKYKQQREEKANAVGYTSPFPLVQSTIFDLPLARYGHQSMTKLAGSYGSNVYVYRAVDYVATACSGIALELYTNRSKTKKLDNHPIIDLLEQPHGGSSYTELIESLVSFAVLTGNGYLYAVMAGGRPKELWVLRPDLMNVQLNEKTNEPEYLYSAGQAKQLLDPKRLLHIKMFNPLDDLLGLSPVAVAAAQVEQLRSGEEWNLALLQNYGRPSGALISQAVLSDNTYLTLKKQVQEVYSGFKNAGRPLILEGGLDWKQFSMNPLELDWSTSKQALSKEIALAIGIPPILLGDSSTATYSNYQEARASFYMETVLPLLDLVVSKLNSWLVPLFGEQLFLAYDKEDIEALQEDRKELINRINSQFQLGYITANEARKASGYGEAEVFEFIRTPDNKIVPLNQLQVYLETIVQAPPANQSSVEDGSKSVGVGGEQDYKAINLGSYEEKTRYWFAFEAKREHWYRTIEQKVRDFFQRQEKKLVEALEQAPMLSEVERYTSQTITSDTEDLVQLYKDIYLSVGGDFSQSTYQAITNRVRKKAVKASSIEGNVPPNALDVWQSVVLDWLRTKAGTKINGITQTTLQQVRQQLEKGVLAGAGIPELAKRIKGLYQEYYENRSTVIARTEVIAASNLGAVAGATQTGLQLRKEWIATRDPRTREEHLKADGQIVGKDDPFIVWGERLDYPGDASHATAKNLIQCRCTVAFIYDEEVEKPKEQQVLGPYRPQQTVQAAVDFMNAKYPGTVFELADGNIQTVNDVFEGLDAVMEKYPDVLSSLPYVGDASGPRTPTFLKKTLEYIQKQQQDINFEGFVTSAQGTGESIRSYMWLNPTSMKKSPFPKSAQNYDPNKMPWRVEDSQKAIGIHEFGHVIHNYLERTIGFKGAFAGLDRQHFGEMGYLMELWTAAHKAEGKQVSVYGATNRYESFAEGFTALYLFSSEKWPAYTKSLKTLLDTFLPEGSSYPFVDNPLRFRSMTPEQQAEVLKAIADLRKKLGIPRGTRFDQSEKAMDMKKRKIKLPSSIDGQTVIWYEEVPIGPDPEQSEDSKQEQSEMKKALLDTIQRSQKKMKGGSNGAEK